MRIHEFITEAAYDSAIDAMKRTYPDRIADIDTQVKWAKAVLKKQDRIVWWLRIIGAFLGGKLDSKLLGDYNFTDTAQLQQDIGHFYGFEFAPIEKYIFQRQPVSQVISDLGLLEQKWKEKNKAAAGVKIMKGDYELFKFNDGTAWWFVDRAFCSDEGRSGQHCGNIVGKQEKKQRILSLRTSENNVILTFILEPNGMLGEMKAKGNQKPQEKYHPHIMKLLLWDKIKGISGMGYLPEMNFSVFDLSDDNLRLMYDTKPNLLKTQLKVTPTDILSAPAFVAADKSLARSAIAASPGVAKLITGKTVATSTPAWEEALAIDPELILNAPDSITNYQQRMMDAVKSREQLLLKVPASLRGNYEFMHKLLTAVPESIAYVLPTTRRYNELAKAAVHSSGWALESIPEELRTTELCEIALASSGYALRAVPKTLVTPKMYKMAVSAHGAALQYVPENMRTTELCMIAVTHSGITLEYVPVNMRTKEVCMAAVKQNGEMIRSVPEELVDDKMLFVAVGSSPYALAAIPRSRYTTELCIAAIEAKDGDAIFLWLQEVYKTLPVCIAAVKRSPYAMQYVPAELRDDVTRALNLKESTHYAVVKSLSESAHISEFKHVSARSAYSMATRGMIVINENGKIVNHSGNEILGKTYFISR